MLLCSSLSLPLPSFHPLSLPLSVSHTHSHTHSAPGDYVGVDTELTFQPGDRRDCVTVTLNTDNVLEEVEQLRLRLDTDQDRLIFDPETTIVNVITIDGGKHAHTHTHTQIHTHTHFYTYAHSSLANPLMYILSLSLPPHSLSLHYS